MAYQRIDVSDRDSFLVKQLVRSGNVPLWLTDEFHAPNLRLLRIVMLVKRNPNPSYCAIGICSIFVIGWVANKFGYTHIEGGDTLWVNMFVWLFALPALIFSATSAVTKTPCIELSGREVRFSSVSTPWTISRIPTDDIIELSTQWTPRTTRCLLSLRLSESAYQATVGEWTWMKRGDGWVHFHLAHADVDPHSVAKMLSDATAIPYTVERDV